MPPPSSHTTGRTNRIRRFLFLLIPVVKLAEVRQAHRAGSPPPSVGPARHVLGPTPQTLVTPRTHQLRSRRRQLSRGATPPSAPQRGAAGSSCLAVASRPSSRSRRSLARKDSALHPLLRGMVGPPLVAENERTTTASADFSRFVPRRCRRDSPDRPNQARDLPG